MAKLRFTFGTMGSGKSTQALQIHHNLRARGLTTLLMTQLDRREGRVSSRLGVSADAEIVEPSSDLFDLIRQRANSLGHLSAVICDEVQFYQPAQCEQLARVVDELGVDVYTFGLLTTFQGVMFDGSARLMELADTRTEIQVEARCWCGARATHNARFVDGVQVISGATVVVGDTVGPTAGEVTYDLLCRRHWMEGAQAARGAQLELLDVDDARRGDHPDRSGPVEVDPDAVPTPLHATQNAGESS
ncbi:MAG: thymidine kinase [Acidimicrobiaceae bacterium]|jgi:thymidine kinase|nr:thymidine kinase [Acidimicrobiaceae bacterium]HAB58500.1 thymidine kinase [Acidimicrobiaceae bacterium]